MDIAPASPERSVMVMVAQSNSPSETALRLSQDPAASEEITQYRPQRTQRRSLQDILQPFSQTDVQRERNPRRLLGEILTEMMAAERRSHAYNDELNEAVEVFRAREAWWRRGLLELQETVGTERAQFEELAQTADTEYRTRVNLLEASVNGSQRQLQMSEQSVQHYQQNLQMLESVTQQLHDNRHALAGQAEATVRMLYDEVSTLKAEKAELSNLAETNRNEVEAAKSRDILHQGETARLRIELDNSRSNVAAAGDQIKTLTDEHEALRIGLTMETDQIRSELLQAKASEAKKQNENNSLRVQLSDGQAAFYSIQLEARQQKDELQQAQEKIKELEREIADWNAQ